MTEFKHLSTLLKIYKLLHRNSNQIISPKQSGANFVLKLSYFLGRMPWIKHAKVLTRSAEETSFLKILPLCNWQYATIPAQHTEDASCKLRLFLDVVSLSPGKQLSRKSQTVEFRTPHLDLQSSGELQTVLFCIHGKPAQRVLCH